MTLTCLIVDSDVAMDPGILELWGDQEAKGTLATLDFAGFIDFVNVGIFKADFTWVPLNLVKSL